MFIAYQLSDILSNNIIKITPTVNSYLIPTHAKVEIIHNLTSEILYTTYIYLKVNPYNLSLYIFCIQLGNIFLLYI